MRPGKYSQKLLAVRMREESKNIFDNVFSIIKRIEYNQRELAEKINKLHAIQQALSFNSDHPMIPKNK